MSLNKKKNETYKKTTIDRKHKEKITLFDLNKVKIDKLNNELIEINNRLEEINKIDYIDYSQEIIAEKANLKGENTVIRTNIRCVTFKWKS